MPSPLRTRWKAIAIAILGIVLLCALGERGLEHLILDRSERLMVRLCGPGSRIGIDEVDVSVLAGDVRWAGIHIEQSQDPSDTLSDRAMRVRGSVDQLAVHGLSVWRLLFNRTLSMRSVLVTRPRLEALLRTDTADARPPDAEGFTLSAINVDSLVIDEALLSARNTEDSMEVRTGPVSVRISAFQGRWTAEKPFEPRFGAITGRIRGIDASLPPLYAVHMDDIALDDGGRSFLALNANIRPLKSAQDYDRFVHYETDLFDVHLDTISFTGFDPSALFGPNTLRMAMMCIAGGDLKIHRDKTMPDAPYAPKALPARLLRELPFLLDVDSLLLDRWNVVYHEKDVHTPDYGVVEFTELQASVHGLHTDDPIPRDTVVLLASTKGFDRAEVTLDARMALADTTDRFIARATIGRLPFNVFNRITADLILLRASAGTIDGVQMTMIADDQHAHGRVDMEYAGLKLELLKYEGAKKPRKLLSGLLNQVVRKENLRSDPRFRHGDFAFQRLKDHSVFNYLWSGLREGMLSSTLPGIVDDLRK